MLFEGRKKERKKESKKERKKERKMNKTEIFMFGFLKPDKG